MAQVTVKINGYVYNVGCEDGQEQHLLAMAGEVEKRIEHIKALGQSGESRLLMLAALLMADEIHDLRVDQAGAAAAGRKSARKSDAAATAADPELPHKLGRLAVRAEQIAEGLEGSTP